MFLNTFLKETNIPKDIIKIILDYKYDLDNKEYFDNIFKYNIILPYSLYINSIEYSYNLKDIIFKYSYNLKDVIFYLQNYIVKDDLITKYLFHFKIINCLGTPRINYVFDKNEYNFCDIIKFNHLEYLSYEVKSISFGKTCDNINKVYITLLNKDDLKILKKKSPKSSKSSKSFKKIKKFFKSLRKFLIKS